MNNRERWLLILNIVTVLIALGFATSFTTMLMILGGMGVLALLSVPSVAFAFLWKKYKQLRNSYQTTFAFLMTIEQQLKAVDQMQITDLKIVNLKQKIRVSRQMIEAQKKRRQQNA